MMTYREQFAEVKRRIDKCEAKRIEFDRCTFMLQQLETTNGNNENGLDAGPKQQTNFVLRERRNDRLEDPYESKCYKNWTSTNYTKFLGKIIYFFYL